ncbi:MAG: hypothetical protein NZ693_02090, partial [Thermoflexales bacterium]|nr:hypothetical protein [Thermoflexales bacterium]
ELGNARVWHFFWAVDFSSDAEQMALATEENNVHLWRTRDGAHLAELPVGVPARAVRFAPAGDLLAVGVLGGQVQLWQTQTRTLVRELIGSGRNFYLITFSPDGSQLAAVDSDGGITVWRTTDGSLLDQWRGLPGGLVVDLVWLPDSERLVLLTTSHLLQLRLGQPAPVRALVRFVACEDAVRAAAFSTDGDWVAAVCEQDVFLSSATQLYLWRVTDGALVRVVNLEADAPLVRIGANKRAPDTPISAALSADLQQVVLGFAGENRYLLPEGARHEGGAVQLRRVDGQVLHTLRGHASGVAAVAISPDSQLLASGDSNGMVMLWRARDGFNTRVLRLRGGVRHLTFSPDGRLLAAATEYESRVWRVADGTPLRTLGSSAKVAFTSDSRAVLLLTPGSQLRILRWEAHGDSATQPAEEFIFDPFREQNFWAALAPNGQLMAIGSESRIVFCDLRDGVAIERHPLRYGAGTVFSADGAQLLNIDVFGQLRVLGIP